MRQPVRILGGFAALGAIALLGVVVVGPGAPVVARAEPAQPGRADGAALYAQTCAACHGPTGLGTDNGPQLLTAGAAGADLMLRTGRMPLANPDGPSLGGRPAFTEAEIVAIVDYVAAFDDGPPIPDVDVTRGDLSVGRAEFVANCAACHGAGGSGDAVGGGWVAPRVLGVPPTQVGEAVRTGPGAMPAFTEAQVSAAELDSIAAYLEWLDSPESSPGGLPIANVGPVSEGFVAWLVGIGLLVLAVRWTERRRARRDEAPASTVRARSPGAAEPDGELP